MKSLLGFFYFIFSLSVNESVCGFHVSGTSSLVRNNPSLNSKASINEFDSSQRDEVTSLIMSLSEEKNDDVRRNNLSSLLKERLNQENSIEAARFAVLWDTTIIEIGSKVQEEARKKAEESVTTECEEENINSDPEVTSNLDSTRIKSAEELKLWAMIDMMIQSKHIIKNAMDGKL